MTETINLRPILFLLGIAGCYSPQHDKRWVAVCLWIYKLIMFISCILWTCRFFIQIDSLSAAFSSIIVATYSLQCIGNWLICWKSFNKRFGNFKQSFDHLQDTVTQLCIDNVRINHTYINRRQNVCVVFTIFLFLTDMLIQILNAYVFQEDIGHHIDSGFNVSSGFSRESNESVGYMTFPLQDNYLTRVLVLLPVGFLTLAVITPPFYLTVINIVLIEMFKTINKHFGNPLCNPKSDFENIEIFRRHHSTLSALVSDFDQDYKYLYGNIFFWTLCQGILSLYMLVKFEQHHIVVLSILVLMGLCITVLAVMAISAALVHEAAHAPLNTIYNINVETISLEKATQLNLFLSKLTGTQIGFTTFGLLTITKEFILTIAGVFLTYFAVLYTL